MTSLEAVTFTYPGASSAALRDFSLAVAPGEVVGLQGPNDAGKTTACLVAAGLAPRVTGGRLEGTVRLVPAAVLFEDQRAQLTGLCDTVWDEVAFGPANLGWSRGEVVEATDEALLMLGIAALRDRDPARLSGGQRQMVALAALMSMRPELLVLDEPVSRLDADARAAVASAVARAAARGAGVLVAEHDEDFLDAIAGRRVRI